MSKTHNSYRKTHTNSKSKGTSAILVMSLCIIIIGSAIMLAGCSGVGSNANTGKRTYYKGYGSLEMKFADESPPLKFNYDSECDASMSCYNEIPIVVEVKNKGASFAGGVLYVHGYDPHMIQIAGGVTPTNAYFGPGANGRYTFNLGDGGFYVGLSGGGYRGTAANIGFRTPNGARYGLGVFTQDGKFKGISISFLDFSTNRVGYRLAPQIYNMYSGANGFYGYNSVIGLEGDTPETPGGGLEVYEFPAYIYNLPYSLESFRQPIRVTACYGYETFVTAMMCVDPKPNNNVKKVCKAGDVSLSGGQGGPVSVTRIEQQPGNYKTVFTIRIHHTKSSKDTRFDELFDYYSLDKCGPSGQTVKATDRNVVYVEYVGLSTMDITQFCTPSSGKVRLDESGNGEISCSAPLDGLAQSAYEAPLEIVLGYGYSTSIERIVQIQKI